MNHVDAEDLRHVGNLVALGDPNNDVILKLHVLGMQEADARTIHPCRRSHHRIREVLMLALVRVTDKGNRHVMLLCDVPKVCQ
ncbi:hypothetical protein D9M69_602970 [compost metagenome]